MVLLRVIFLVSHILIMLLMSHPNRYVLITVGLFHLWLRYRNYLLCLNLLSILLVEVRLDSPLLFGPKISCLLRACVHFSCVRARIQAPGLKQADGLLIHKRRDYKGQLQCPFELRARGRDLEIV